MSAPDRPEPPPTPSAGPVLHDLVAADLMSRKAFGITKYGMPLRANNGRDMLMDAYQEALDLVVYLRGCLTERDRGIPILDRDSER